MAGLTVKKVNLYINNSFDDLYDNKIWIRMDEANMYHIHFAFVGQQDTPYQGGYYYGLIILHQDHPHKAPSQFMLSPSGRFHYAEHYPPRDDHAICTSQTGFHQDTWSSQTGFDKYLFAFIAIFPQVDNESKGIGSLETSVAEKKKIAKTTKAFLINNTKFKEIFPEFHKALVDNKDPFPPLKKKAKIQTSKTSEDLEDKLKRLGLGSDDEDNSFKKKKVDQIKKKIISDSEESEEEIKPKKKKKVVKKSDEEKEIKPKKKKKPVSESESESGSESEEEIKPKKKISKKKKISSSESSSESEEEVSKKKRKSGKKY